MKPSPITAPHRRIEPSVPVTDRQRFVYRRACETDVAETFRLARLSLPANDPVNSHGTPTKEIKE